MRRYEIADEQWNQIKDLLPPDKLPRQGRPPKPNRDILNAIIWVARSGAPWRDLPERFGPWQTVYDRFNKWSKNRIFEQIFEIIGVDADMQDLSMDSTSIKVHQHAAGAKKGRKMQGQIRK